MFKREFTQRTMARRSAESWQARAHLLPCAARRCGRGRCIGSPPPARIVGSGWLILAASVLAGCGSPDLAVSQRFQTAQELFDSATAPAQFLQAAAIYEEILDSGFVSGAVLYNQGNAYMRAGQRGRAIASYRRAMRYRPRDAYLAANLTYALGGAAANPEPRSLIRNLLFWQDWLGYPEKFYLTFALGALTLVLGMVHIARRQPWLRRLALAGVGLTIILAISAGYDWYRFGFVECGAIVSPEVVARKGNAESYEPAFNQPLEEGTEFTVLERRRDWLRIRIGDQQEGWIPARSAVVYRETAA